MNKQNQAAVNVMDRCDLDLIAIGLTRELATWTAAKHAEKVIVAQRIVISLGVKAEESFSIAERLVLAATLRAEGHDRASAATYHAFGSHYGVTTGIVTAREERARGKASKRKAKPAKRTTRRVLERK
jgi:hypothetical protein